MKKSSSRLLAPASTGIRFSENLYSEVHDFAETGTGTSTLSPSAPGSASSPITGIEVRLSQVLVKDNRTPRIWPFPGLAGIYFLCIVVSDTEKKPVNIDLRGFEKVNDGDALHIDRTLFYWKKKPGSKQDPAPSQIHLFLCLIKSKEPLRDTGRMLKMVSTDRSFKSAAGELRKLLKKSGDLAALSGIVFNLAGTIGRWLGEVDDKPLLAWSQSFTDINGDFDVVGRTDKQASNQFASMSLSVLIRDAAREQGNSSAGKK